MDGEFLSSLNASLRNKFGRNMSSANAREACIDVSKFLKYAEEMQGEEADNPSPEVISCLRSSEVILRFLQKLEENGVESSGCYTKFSRIELALVFARKECGWRKNFEQAIEVEETLEQILAWKSTLQRREHLSRHKKLFEQAERLEELGGYESVLSHPDLISDVKKALETPDEKESFLLLRGYICLYLFLECLPHNSSIKI